MKLARLSACLALAMVPACALACGPDFPADLLSDRAGTLANLPEGAFYFEVQRLVTPAQRLPVVERFDARGMQQQITRESIEREWWGDRYDKLAALRTAASADAAFAGSGGFPDEARHYIAGAVAFAHADYEAANGQFNAVLALPEAQRTHYGIWAHYMLGRSAYAQGKFAPARAAFASARTQAEGAAQDPLGIGASSLGDEARAALGAGDDAAAVALYAQQAALNSLSGRESLLLVARAIVADEARLQRDVRDALTQRLLVAYLFSRSDELADTRIEPGTQTGTPPPAPTPAKITRFLDAVEKNGVDQVQGIDRLAALAYRSGRYDLAARLAPKDSSGLAWWVRAKLALRGGDATAAAQAYAQAAKAFPAAEQWGEPQMEIYAAVKPQCRVEAEHGTLALSRGEYLAAMEHLYNAASQYWSDAAYVAERVLSVEELKTFVDARPPQPSVTKKSDEDGAGGYGNPQSPLTSLRALLGRRLLRAERFDEALAYFDEPALRAKAQAYVDARHAAQHGDRIEQAQAWFAAAHAARFDGINLLGYELDPDYLVYEGDFDLNGHADADGNTLLTREDIKLPDAGVAKDEPTRLGASRAQPLKRFHYRYNAVDFAQKSADLLPPRTQAFAAVLCHATSWLIDRDPPVAQQVYTRYLKQGAYVPWGDAFGRSCPAPDFPAAARRLHKERVAYWRHLARKSLPYAAVLAALAIVAIALGAQRRRTRKAGVARDAS